MKKGTRILLIVLGVISMLPVCFFTLISAAAIFLPEKLFVRISSSNYSQTVSPYPFSDSVLPEDPVPCEDDSLRLYLPGNLRYAGTDAHGLLYTNAGEGLMHTTQVYVKFTSVSASYNFGRIKPVYLAEGIGAFNRTMPDNEYELWDFVLNLTEDQFDERWPSLRREDARSRSLYVTAIGAKEKVWKCNTKRQYVFCREAFRTEDIYHFENETAKGFVILREKEETVPVQYSLDLWLYDKNDLNRSCRAILLSEDLQLLTQIANSAEMKPLGGFFDDESAYSDDAFL